MKRLGLLLLLLAAATSAVRADYDSDAAERKADYLFMEAMRQKALGHDDLYFALMGRALELTPDKTGREAYERGVQETYMAGLRGDSVGFAKSLALSEGYFNAHPRDAYAGAYLARIHAETGNIDRALEIYEILEKEKPNSVALAGNHADLLVGAKRLDEAVEIYRRLEKTMGRSPAITQRISNVRIWQGDTIAAFREIDDLIAAQPRSVDALQLGASAASAFGMPEKALDYLERALALDPTNGTSYYYAANAYKLLGRNDEYDAAIRGALTGDDLEREAKLELLRYYISEVMDKDNFAESLAPIFESLVEQYSHDYQIRVVYMSYFAAQQRWAEAAEQLAQAIDIDSSNPIDFNTLTRLYVSADNMDAARSTVESGLKLFPDDVELYQLLSGLCINSGEYAAAADALNRALTIPVLTDTDRSMLYQSQADIAQLDSSVGNPTELYEKALELDPANDLAMNNYAYFLATSDGNLLRAKELISKAVLYNPGSSTYYDTYAWVLFKLGDLEEAKRYIDMALISDRSDVDPDNPQMAELLQHAGDIYSKLGLHDKAQEYWDRANQLDPGITSE